MHSPNQEAKLGTFATLSIGIGGMVIVVTFAANLVVRSEYLFNDVKTLLLAAFIVAGFLTPMAWTPRSLDDCVAAPSLVAGAMRIIPNDEGFELIVNASKHVAKPKCTLPIAFVGDLVDERLSGVVRKSIKCIVPE